MSGKDREPIEWLLDLLIAIVLGALLLVFLARWAFGRMFG